MSRPIYLYTMSYRRNTLHNDNVVNLLNKENCFLLTLSTTDELKFIIFT